MPVASPAAAAPALPGDAPLALRVAAAMAEALGMPSVPPTATSSRSAATRCWARLMAHLGTMLGRRLGLRLLFAHPTPAALASALEQLAPEALTPTRLEARADQRTAPLSLMQQRMDVENLTPGTPFNQLPSAHRLAGPLDEAALRDALQRFTDRQPALRTGHRTHGRRRAAARARPRGPAPAPRRVPRHAARRRTRGRRAGAHRRAVAGGVRPGHGPAFRLHLFRLSAEDHVLFFMVHHIVWDGASSDVMQAELAELYGAAAAGRAPALQPLALTYGDFAAWQRRMDVGPRAAAPARRVARGADAAARNAGTPRRTAPAHADDGRRRPGAPAPARGVRRPRAPGRAPARCHGLDLAAGGLVGSAAPCV